MKDDELKEIFLAEALENNQELNKLFTELEKNHQSKGAINAIFRITHTLKANAAGMGYEGIAEMAHVLEDIFSEIKNQKIEITAELFNDLYRANDMLGALIQNIKTNNPGIRYKGLKRKLEVVLDKARNTGFSAIHVGENSTQINTSSQENQNTEATTTNPQENESASFELMAKNQDEGDEPEINAPTNITFSDIIQIPIRKLDNLMNLVGELIIERDRVIALNTEDGRKRANDFASLMRITSELQYSVMDVRLVQVDILFSKFHRIVRDVAVLENKKVNLILEGTENEIDRTVLQIISDSLIHLVRNAVSHGIETPQERLKKGKSETGTIKLAARSEKDEVIIEVSDDGKGIDTKIIKQKAIEKGIINQEIADLMNEDDAIQLIFEPGFSSAEVVTKVSGRGVGMDVVKRSIDAIGGKVIVKTTVGSGSIISLSLPSSMAVKGALLFELSKNAFAIPLVYTDAVISIKKQDIHKVGSGLIATHLNKNIAVVFLNDVFSLEKIGDIHQEGVLHQSFNQTPDNQKLYCIVVSYNNRDVGFVVDKLLQQKEIVEKQLGKPLDQVKMISGATILGNGNVCLVLDVPSILNLLFKSSVKMTQNLV